MKKQIIGIDLGTTNSCVAILEGGEPVIIPNSEGHRTTPSVVAFSKTGEKLVGQIAKRQAITNPTNTVFSAKRLIGRKYSEIKNELNRFPYKVVEGKNGDAAIQLVVEGKERVFTPQEISSFILSKLKSDAESYLGTKVSQAVITVPAYFNDAQRQATKDAGKIAGLEVLRIINEPTAASLAYGLDKKQDEHIAVYDLGGGTFDVSILELGDGVFEVKSTNGDTQLGGDNWDEALINWFISEFQEKEGINLGTDPMALQRLKEEAEKCKIALSSSQQYDVNLPFITATQEGPKHLIISVSRSQMDKLCADLVSKTQVPFHKCLKDAKLDISNVDEVVLVGGMTRSPAIIECVRNLTKKEPHRGVNPDEVVAIGAAIQGAVLSGDVKDVLLLDVNPLTLGIETAGGVCTPMIPRNTTIPTKKSEIFSTYEDNQSAVDIKILQGERSMASDNKLLGNFRLDGISPAMRGTPQIEVTFDIDANGILSVSAVDKQTGKQQQVQITNSSGLSQEEIDRLTKEAEMFAQQDQEAKEVAEKANQLDNLVYQAEQLIKQNGVSDPSITEMIAKAKQAITSKTKDELINSLQVITQLLTNLNTPVQENKQPDNSQENKDYVDADFEVVDDQDSK